MMKIWLGTNAPKHIKNSAVTIGNFDGVNIGHQHIVQRLADEARARNLFRIALVFEPQPTEFFSLLAQKNRPFRLSPLRDKLRLLQKTECLDAVWVQRFNSTFAHLTAQMFIQKILREQLNTRYLLVGDDFRFGQNRGGDFNLLAAQNDFVTERTPSILVLGSRASSTAGRQALESGDVARATQILGHDYTLSGHVKHGQKLGRILGCPTANIHLPSHRYALQGVFVVRVMGRFGERFGVASFGVNPTVSQTIDTKLEVHLFDFSGDLYGQRVEVAFLHKLRNEVKFDSLDALKQQIWIDIQTAKTWLAA